MSILLTIITVVKNDKKNICKTINSVLAQDIKNLEYVIFDGNSTDGTSQLIENYKTKKIKYFRNNDKNLYDAINKSIKLSKGKYIGLLHSGDVFKNKKHLKKINKYLKKDPDLISGNVAFFKKDKRIKITRIWRYPIKRINSFSIFKIPHPSVYIKKSLISKVKNYDTGYKISSDLDFLIKISKIKKLNFIYFDDYFVLMKNKGLSTNIKYLILKIYEDFQILYKNYSVFFIFFYIYKILIKIFGLISTEKYFLNFKK